MSEPVNAALSDQINYGAFTAAVPASSAEGLGGRDLGTTSLPVRRDCAPGPGGCQRGACYSVHSATTRAPRHDTPQAGCRHTL